MPTYARSALVMLLGLLLGLLLVGCAATPLEVHTIDEARGLPLRDGTSGDALTWDGVIDRIEAADVVIVGERHDDAMGHAFQAAVVDAVFERWPSSALSMEMLDREEQMLVDDYVERNVDRARFLKRAPQAWTPGPQWEGWYQPMLDRVRGSGGRVVAANAPRRYVTLARRAGYEELDRLPEPRRSLFDLPEEPSTGRYVERLRELIKTDDDIEWTDAMEATFQSGFRSQSVWDATMAASIASAVHDDAPKVVHLVGQFHSDFDGGLVQQLRRRAPEARILVISMQHAAAPDPDGVREDDVGRAGVVVYTE